MVSFILNDESIRADVHPGTTVLDFVRYQKHLKGTKIGCREGDCGACTVLVGELVADQVRYRTMTSCLMPLANASAKHIVTIEGINPPNRELTPVQQAMLDESGTQCGFCTVGFVMSLTGFCIDDSPKTTEAAISALDGNICRCTGYKSIERAAAKLASLLSEPPASAGGQFAEKADQWRPAYFKQISDRLNQILSSDVKETGRPIMQAVPTVVGGGTDLYVQRPEEMAKTNATPLLFDDELRGITEAGGFVEIGGSATVTDLLDSPLMQSIFPNLYKHLKLVSSTPIRNMATLAGNFVNASPIGDMTAWFLALNAEITLCTPEGGRRTMLLRDLYLGYKQLAKTPEEIITKIRFNKPTTGFHFNFEKVSKRTYLDIASVNTAISLTVSEPGAVATGRLPDAIIREVHVSAGGVAPTPLYLTQTSQFLRGRQIVPEIINAAADIVQTEISPISDVRGSETYKRLLLRQLFQAHFIELFNIG